MNTMSRPTRCGFISLLYSIGDKPLNLWSKHISLDGRIRRVKDEDLNGDRVIEIMGPHETPVPSNITCPANLTDVLNIKLPILVLVVKNLDLMFKLEFQLIDKKEHRRKFTLTTYNHEKLPIVNVNAARMPLKLDENWNNLEINLQTLCNDIYGTDYLALQRIIIYPNCRVRRIYLQDRHYEQDETPVELCQAFFDMYMLKWGIHLVERSCQTEETYTGPLQPCDLEYFTTESNMSVTATPTRHNLLNDSHASQIKREVGRSVGVTSTLGNGKTVVLKNNSKSVNELGKTMERPNSQKLDTTNNERSPSVTNYSVNLPVEKEKRKLKSANYCDKDKKKLEHRIKKGKEQVYSKTDVDSMSLKLKEKKELLKSFPHIEKSQYLKMQIGENFLNSKPGEEGHIFQEWPYKYSGMKQGKGKESMKTQSRANGGPKSKTSNIKRILDPHTNLSYFDPTYMMAKRECVANAKAQMNVNVNCMDSDASSSIDAGKAESSQGDGLQCRSVKAIQDIISEVQRIRQQLHHHDDNTKKSLTRKEPSELLHIVPPFVEVQAKLSETRSKKTVLSTDQAVGDYLELRHVVNKKILEKLQDKGMTMTEVELSIYNSKNRRNCYGQGKLIESRKVCTSKGSGLSSVKPLQMDVSLRREQLSLNDRMCTQLRNELDTTLLQLKSTHVRMTPQMVNDTIGTIIKSPPKTPPAEEFFTAQEAEFIRKKVYYTEDMLKRDRDVEPYCEYLKDLGNPIKDFINNSDKYTTTQMLNVLFERELHDDEAELRNV